ncbi:glycoside hydrolase family 172 protein [Diplocloster hominis]|uniref:glycoside hydrolase family 172 protein n=1 Tax=Diplocloster hominis TaxID=3079010 RepID=UPI0031BAF550
MKGSEKSRKSVLDDVMCDMEQMGFGLYSLSRLSKAKSRAINAENPTGANGCCAMAEEGTGKQCAADLGRGWKISPSVNVEPGQTVTLAEIEGPGVIQSLWFGGYVGRDFILRIYWEDQENPSVECPYPDFFACGFTDNSRIPTGGPLVQINSVPLIVNPNRALNSFWRMPFRKNCRITMENRGKEDRCCYYQVNYSLEEIRGDEAYFHAQFRMSAPLKPMEEHVILDGVNGTGHYVGTSLSVGLNGTGKWWGEGEVKFYLDGDLEFPSICSTGTEDYFGGAYNWEVDGAYRTYTSLYMGMHHVMCPDGLYQSQQRFSMYRWHIPDPIRFSEHIRVTIQDLGWMDREKYLARRDDFYSVAYWYQSLPTSPFEQLPHPHALIL